MLHFAQLSIFLLDYCKNVDGTCEEASLCSRFCHYCVMLSSLYGTSAFAENPQPPVISDFGAKQGPEDFWTFSGIVSDEDDNVEGMIVYFGGVLAGYGYTNSWSRWNFFPEPRDSRPSKRYCICPTL